MAKVGTAHIEIKPVVNEEALGEITEQVANAVAEGVRRGLAPCVQTNGKRCPRHDVDHRRSNS